MKENREDIELGKFISLILRHSPETIGITLDENGWAKVEDLIEGINRARKRIDFDTLERIVKENNKQRYSFNDDRTKIRANQGHSIEVDVELAESIPPKHLYHGTSKRFIDSIMDLGIQKQSRQYVHLSMDFDTALSVGKRHGKPIVLKIDSIRMFNNGHKFYLSKNKVWLTDSVPVEYIVIQSNNQ
ncbi:RNA 2'-phosphotransferase [Clostridium fungisolvens]|uniref:Probable RNA 2'-phosphotransferase n=1 Tax=Clostridium fungisolvens TaxID=1604897 RepID=A0A6V8SMV7_9CLOT|nr:RNA 2'-phosphotransferase [Clostridium fungisolvens]GFP76508.1 putative RNA 2'-phosphotransferase [Clostridium fungisolvens]